MNRLQRRRRGVGGVRELCLAGLLGAALLCPGFGKERQESAVTPSGKNAAGITPEAQQVLKRMSTALAAAKAFTFETAVAADQPSESGSLVRTSRHGRIVVSRPDRLYAEAAGDDGERALWYSGQSLSLLDKEANEYATVKVPGRIDKMLDFAMEKYEVSLPLADLVFPDPYSVLTENAETGVLLGREPVLGHECDHLLFTQENVDWQIWVDAGAVALPRKVVITQKTEPGSPQFIALLDKWDLAAAPGAEVFAFRAPEGAAEVSMPDLINPGGDEEVQP